MTAVACFGDSLVYGYPYGPEVSWLRCVEEINPQLKLFNYGECGACCDDIKERMLQTLIPKYVKHYLFLGGANDVIEGRPLNVILSDVEAARTWAEMKGYKFAIVMPWLSSNEKFNQRMLFLREKLLSEEADKCKLFDFQGALNFENEKEQLFLDEIHPLPATYKRIGAYAEPLLRDWLIK